MHTDFMYIAYTADDVEIKFKKSICLKYSPSVKSDEIVAERFTIYRGILGAF